MVVKDGWPDSASGLKHFTSFDGGTTAHATIQRPDRYGFFSKGDARGPVIAQGAGLSFPAASFASGATTIDMQAFDRILDFDSATGVVEVEAGVMLGDLFHFLEARGFHLVTQPGYPAISVGGCIAADVHGKNVVRDGTFVKQVAWLQLFHPSHGFVELTPDRDPDLFRATCGGLGLTGIIVRARLRSVRLPGRAVKAVVHAISDLADTAKMLPDLLKGSDFGYGWHELTPKQRNFGRGVISAFHFVDGATALRPAFQGGRMTADDRRTLPFSLISGTTYRALNAIQKAVLRSADGNSKDVFASMFPFYGKELYFGLYGRRGFHECQVIVPHDRFSDYAAGLREAVARTQAIICFSASKLFDGESDLVRFDGRGVSLALHLPRSQSSVQFLQFVDRLTVELGGRPNAVKDSRLPRSVFEATYPECDRFRTIVGAWDPKRTFRSALTERLGL